MNEEKEGMSDADKMLFGAVAVPALILLAIVSILPFGMWNAFVAWKLYHWFIVPLGLPMLGLWSFWGVLMFLSMFKPSSTSEADIAKSYKKMLGNALALAIVLVVAYVLKQVAL